MRSPKPSTAFTRPSSSIDVDHGGPSKPSSSPRSNGWTGSTIGGCWNPSATSLQPKLKTATTLCSNRLPWQRDSNQTASGKPGAVQKQLLTLTSQEQPAPYTVEKSQPKFVLQI